MLIATDFECDPLCSMLLAVSERKKKKVIGFYKTKMEIQKK